MSYHRLHKAFRETVDAVANAGGADLHGHLVNVTRALQTSDGQNREPVPVEWAQLEQAVDDLKDASAKARERTHRTDTHGTEYFARPAHQRDQAARQQEEEQGQAPPEEAPAA
jgi:hypothetical protein